mmetsp:Transcript_87126/g.251281  ORF Transcript_87126/g.251281 Transcript_87126/m.251281 type:complete len:216 (-) Transcript_87126:24-671(-)
MKLSIPLVASAMMLMMAAATVSAFTPQFPTRTISITTLNAAVELKPEPEGGDELTAVKSMDGSRMKNMGPAEKIKNDDGTVYKFWLKATAKGALIKELHNQVLKDAAKKANFPGFRKGQVPPFAMPQIRGFAVQEGIIQTVQSAVDAYGLKSISGKDGEVEVLEDIPEIAKGYKVGDDIQFTATFKAIFDPKLSAEKDAENKEAQPVINVEAESV